MQIFVDGLMRRRTDGDKQSVKISNGIRIDMPQGAFIAELRISNRARTVDELWTYVQHCKSKKLIPQ